MRLIPLISFISVTLAACTTSPLGRSQFSFLPDSQLNEMGITAYEQIKKETPTTSDSRTTNYVNCVANNIVKVVKGGPASWEVTVFDKDTANAFALPGGKIGVHTGLLKVAKNQNQLAAVVGHEIGHVLARHSNERASTQLATQGGLQVLETLAGAPSAGKSLLMGALGLGAQYGVVLPYGRTQESEADLIGVDLMADAGFDPRESVSLWQNMAAASKGSNAEFLSTHPSHERRIADLNARMADAMVRYQAAQSRGLRPSCG